MIAVKYSENQSKLCLYIYISTSNDKVYIYISTSNEKEWISLYSSTVLVLSSIYISTDFIGLNVNQVIWEVINILFCVYILYQIRHPLLGMSWINSLGIIIMFICHKSSIQIRSFGCRSLDFLFVNYIYDFPFHPSFLNSLRTNSGLYVRYSIIYCIFHNGL